MGVQSGFEEDGNSHTVNDKNLYLSIYEVILNKTEDMHLPCKQSNFQTSNPNANGDKRNSEPLSRRTL